MNNDDIDDEVAMMITALVGSMLTSMLMTKMTRMLMTMTLMTDHR